MWNPLKNMNPVEKRALIGGIASGLTYYANMYASYAVPYPAPLNSKVSPYLPTNANIIGSVAPPVVLYLAEKVSKNTSTKEKLSDLTFGSFLYAGPNLVRDIVSNTAFQAGVDARPTAAARLPTPVQSKFVQTAQTMQRTMTPVIRPTFGKYMVTS